MKPGLILSALLGSVAWAGLASAQSPPANTIPVTVDNFIRAESDLYFGGILKEVVRSESSSTAANRRGSTIRPSSA